MESMWRLLRTGLAMPDGLIPLPSHTQLPHGKGVSRITRSNCQQSAGTLSGISRRSTSSLEPVSGFEPLTCRLQDGCSAN